MTENKMDNSEYERILQENVTLKSDTLIFREDIKHLTEVNKKLENELEISRKNRKTFYAAIIFILDMMLENRFDRYFSVAPDLKLSNVLHTG